MKTSMLSRAITVMWCTLESSAAIAQTRDAGQRTVLAAVTRPRGRIALVALGGPTEAPRPLGIECDARTSEYADWGDGLPTLSRDGAWVAYTRGDLPYVRRVEGGREIAVMPPGRRRGAEVSFVAWSPDASKLLYHLHGRSTLDGPPAVLPSPEGFYALEVATMRRVALPAAVPVAIGWVDDTAVLGWNAAGGGSGALLRVPLDGGAPTVLSTVPGPGEAQPFHPVAGWVSLLVGSAGRTPGDSRVEVRRPDGSGAREVTPRAAWAAYQSPQLSPDGARVAYQNEATRRATTLDVAPTGEGAPRTIIPCAGCRYAWDSPTSLIVWGSGPVRRVTLDGASAPITLPHIERVFAADSN